MNPFELTAGPFLTLYWMLYLFCLAAALIWRRGDVPQAEVADLSLLNPIELAYLAGGPLRATDTAVVELLTHGAAELVGSSNIIAPSRTESVVPARLVAFQRCLAAPARLDRLVGLFAPALAPVQAELATLGMVFPPAQAKRMALQSTVFPFLLMAFGVVRVVLGISRGRPVGILVLFLLVTAGTVLWLAGKPPRITRSGTEALERHMRRNRRMMRAPTDSELSTALALGGAAVLMGTPYAAYAKLRAATSDGGGAGSDGGGSSGCGGGGGGGGCGGCSS